jgi:hypothetical protein
MLLFITMQGRRRLLRAAFGYVSGEGLRVMSRGFVKCRKTKRCDTVPEQWTMSSRVPTVTRKYWITDRIPSSCYAARVFVDSPLVTLVPLTAVTTCGSYSLLRVYWCPPTIHQWRVPNSPTLGSQHTHLFQTDSGGPVTSLRVYSVPPAKLLWYPVEPLSR